MDSFEQNKYNSVKFIEAVLSNTTIVSYGFITAIDFDSVVVSPAVSDGRMEKIRCVFMNLGDPVLTVNRKPTLQMTVLVLSPNKAAEGMYEPYEQLNMNEGRDCILTGSPAVYSSQYAICIPITNSIFQALNSITIDSTLITAEIKTEIMASLYGAVELDLFEDTSIELHEGTEHFRGCYGNMEQTFGMVQGIGGAEKEGDYIYKETYGKFSSVEKNYESGAVITVGKAYEKPFLDNKGALVDSSAPVTIELGTGAPVTLTFGDSAMTVTADAENGLDIVLTGALKVSLTADAGKFSIANTSGSLKAIMDKIADLFTNMTTIGPNVVPGAPYTAAATPATATLAAEIKTLVAGLLE